MELDEERNELKFRVFGQRPSIVIETAKHHLYRNPFNRLRQGDGDVCAQVVQHRIEDPGGIDLNGCAVFSADPEVSETE